MVTPYGMHRRTGWPETPWTPWSITGRLCWEKAGSWQLPLQRPCASSPLCSPACQGSGWSACCVPAAAASFSSSAFRHSDSSLRIPVPPLSPLLCQTNFSPLTSQLRSSSRKPSLSLPRLPSSVRSGDTLSSQRILRIVCHSSDHTGVSGSVHVPFCPASSWGVRAGRTQWQPNISPVLGRW